MRGGPYGSEVEQESFRKQAQAARPRQRIATQRQPVPPQTKGTPEDVLFAATARPDEPLGTLAPDVAELEEWTPLLQYLASFPDAHPMLRDLARRAEGA